MWRCRSVRGLSRQWVCAFTTGKETHKTPIKLYVIAGEASGDAIGAKVIRALQRNQMSPTITFQGIGGPQMCEAGNFKSLFPMQELSVMGLVEVLPHMWRYRQRIRDTLRHIEQYQPNLILTIDSKGFAFRVLKALQANEEKQGTQRVKKVHYVAPSVWAYKRRGSQDFARLKRLLDAMITILPFEETLFRAQEHDARLLHGACNETERSWCHFVGHPSVEDFLEVNGVFEKGCTIPLACVQDLDAKIEADALLDLSTYRWSDLVARGTLMQRVTAIGRGKCRRENVRKSWRISPDAFVICALVGSRTNEVKKSLEVIVKGIEAFKQKKQHDIYVVLPTIGAVEKHITSYFLSVDVGFQYQVLTDLSTVERLQLFQSSDAAVAVSGTVVLETTLAGLPTIVIYRANWLTEWVTKQLAAVRFVSVPNLLLGKAIIPELLFSNCTVPKVARALSDLQHQRMEKNDALHLAMALSTLTRWHEGVGKKLHPIRASDLAAKHIFKVLQDQ